MGSSSGSERLAAAALANKLRDRVGEGIVHLTDGQEEDLDDEELAVWSKHLPLQKRDLVRPAENDRRLSTIVRRRSACIGVQTSPATSPSTWYTLATFRRNNSTLMTPSSSMLETLESGFGWEGE